MATVNPIVPESEASNNPPDHVDSVIHGIPDLAEGEAERADKRRVLLFHGNRNPNPKHPPDCCKFLKQKFGVGGIDLVNADETKSWWQDNKVPEMIKGKEDKLTETYYMVMVSDEERYTSGKAISCFKKRCDGDFHKIRFLFCPHYEEKQFSFTVGRNLNLFDHQDAKKAIERGSMRKMDYIYITNADEDAGKESFGIVAFSAIEIGAAALLKSHSPLSSICPSSAAKREYKSVTCSLNVTDYDYDDHTFHTLINGPKQEAIFTGEEMEFSMITTHKTKRSTAANIPLALNCKVDDGKLDIVVVLKETAPKMAKLLINAEEIDKSGDDVSRWYGGQPKVLYVKPGEVVLTLAEQQEIGIDGIRFKCGTGGDCDLSQKVRSGSKVATELKNSPIIVII